MLKSINLTHNDLDSYSNTSAINSFCSRLFTIKSFAIFLFSLSFVFFNALTVFAEIQTTQNLDLTSKESNSTSRDKLLNYSNQGNSYYKQKKYIKAIEKFTQSLKYLSAKDEFTQKQLARTYTRIAESYKRMQNRKQTALFYNKALDVYNKLNDKQHIARTLNTLAEAERYLGNLVLALNYSTRSLTIHKEINDPEGYAKALMGAGIIYRNIGRYEKSLAHIHQAHLYYAKNNDPKGIAKTSIQSGLIYSKLEQFGLAKSYYLLVLEQPNDEIPPKTLASASRELAVIDLNAADYESAMLMIKRAHSIYKVEKDKSKESLSARIIANIYRAQEDAPNAIKYYRKSLDLALSIKSKEYQIKAQTPLAAILITKNADESIALAQSSLSLATQINDKGQVLYAYRTLRQAYDYQENYKKSLRYAKKEIELRKIIQKDKDDNELILVKANLHSHKLETELTSLRKELKLEQLEISKKNNEIEIAQQARKINELELIKNKYFNVALACLLIFCLLVVAFIYRCFVASKERNVELNLLASRDPLTNCYNRRSLFNFMNKYFDNTKVNDQCCIIMADIDHFKSVNDTYGHSAGDTVINGVANILQSCVRQQNDIVARFGGEEFCIVLDKISQDQAMSIAEKMRIKVQNNHFGDITVTSSFGVSTLQFQARTPDELIEQADIALYKSKSLGRNQVTLWNESIETSRSPY